MILKFILDIIIEIVSFCASTLGDLLPDIDFIRYEKDLFNLVGEYSKVAVNGLYFLFGEFMFIVIDFIVIFFTYRYFIFPIAVIIRRVFIKGGDT